MARTFGKMSGLAWPSRTAVSPRNWYAWSRKNAGNGQGSSNPNFLFDGVVPVTFEQHGCPSPCAITFLHHILRRKVAKLEQGSHLTHRVAWMIAARELLAPISCILLVMHHQMFQECCPIVQTPDQTREKTATGSSMAFSQPDSHGEPWPDADPWQGQGSQLGVESTPWHELLSA